MQASSSSAPTSSSSPAKSSSGDRVYCTEDECEKRGVHNSKSSYVQHTFTHLAKREQFLFSCAYCTHCGLYFDNCHTAYGHFLAYRSHKIEPHFKWNGEYSDEYTKAYDNYRRLKMETTRFSTTPQQSSSVQAQRHPVEGERAQGTRSDLLDKTVLTENVKKVLRATFQQMKQANAAAPQPSSVQAQPLPMEEAQRPEEGDGISEEDIIEIPQPVDSSNDVQFIGSVQLNHEPRRHIKNRHRSRSRSSRSRSTNSDEERGHRRRRRSPSRSPSPVLRKPKKGRVIKSPYDRSEKPRQVYNMLETLYVPNAKRPVLPPNRAVEDNHGRVQGGQTTHSGEQRGQMNLEKQQRNLEKPRITQREPVEAEKAPVQNEPVPYGPHVYLEDEPQEEAPAVEKKLKMFYPTEEMAGPSWRHNDQPSYQEQKPFHFEKQLNDFVRRSAERNSTETHRGNSKAGQRVHREEKAFHVKKENGEGQTAEEEEEEPHSEPGICPESPSYGDEDDERANNESAMGNEEEDLVSENHYSPDSPRYSPPPETQDEEEERQPLEDQEEGASDYAYTPDSPRYTPSPPVDRNEVEHQPVQEEQIEEDLAQAGEEVGPVQEEEHVQHAPTTRRGRGRGGAAGGGATRTSRQRENQGTSVAARGRGRGRDGKASGARRRKDSDDAYRTSGRMPLRMGSDRSVAARTRHANNVLYKVDFSDDDL